MNVMLSSARVCSADEGASDSERVKLDEVDSETTGTGTTAATATTES